MDTREYIESGILDLYGAGLLPLEEMRDVELKACQFSEVKAELEKIQGTLENYAVKYAAAPPSAVKERIMMQIEASDGHLSSTGTARVVPMQKSNRGMMWLAAASVALLVAMGALAIKFSTQSSEYKQQVAELKQKQDVYQNELNAVKVTMEQEAQQLALITHPATVKIEMKGTKLSPESLALIFWNKETKTVYLDVRNLPQAPSDKQYQLWFIDPEKGPVSAGVFDATPNELMKMIDAPLAAAFAVTLEPKGGSVSPTLDQMYVVGNTPS